MKNFLFAIVIACPMATWAQDIKPIDLKTGLWETTVTQEISGMPAMPPLSEEQLANMPPEARARLEAAMKGRGGAGSPRTSTVKSCIVREALNKPLYDNGDQTCTRKLVSATSSSQQIHVECARSNMKTTGDLNLERVDSEHTKGTMLLKAAGTGNDTAAGRTMDIKISINMKWLASDCGNVKPAGDK